jgi:hypothetical protein
VDDVARSGHERRQPVGRRLAAAWIGAGLHGMDVEVERARMLRTGPHHALERRQDLRGLGLHGAVGLPQVPRAKVHEGVREQRRRVEVVWEALAHLAHRVGVRAVKRRAIGRRRGGVALRQRLDGGALARADSPREAPRLLDRRVRRLLALRVRRAVVVRAVGQRDPPVAHRAPGVEARPLAEGLLGLDVVEPVHEPEALVEVRLGLRRIGRDGLVVAAEALEEQRRLGRRAPGVVMGGELARASRQGEREEAQDRTHATSHLEAPLQARRIAGSPTPPIVTRPGHGPKRPPR